MARTLVKEKDTCRAEIWGRGREIFFVSGIDRRLRPHSHAVAHKLSTWMAHDVTTHGYQVPWPLEP